MKQRVKHRNIIIIILLQKFASFYFWSPAEVPRMQGSAGFCSLVAIFFSLPFFVPLTSKSSAFTGPLSSSILSTCPNHRNLFSETLPISLHPSFHESSHCSFYLSRFSHISFATFSFLWSSASFHLPFSMPNIQHHKLGHFSHSFCIRCL